MNIKALRRMQENYKTVVDMGYEVVGVFLQGSQNYELDYEGSDVDCKAIIIPKFEDIVLNNKPISTTLVLENNEHIDLKDIRLMFDCFKKQNINFVEILFTKYACINEKYRHLIQPLLDNRELIGRYNNYDAIKCMAGMCMEKYKAMEHPYPATLHKIEKFGYDGKQLHHLLRVKEFMDRYIQGEKYQDCLVSKQRDFLVGVKTNKEFNLEEARVIASETLKYVNNKREEYMTTHEVVVNKEVEEILRNVLIDVIKLSFSSSLDSKS